MSKQLDNKVGEMCYDNLIAGITPPIYVNLGIIAKLTSEATLPRGTVFAKGEDSKLYVLGETGANRVADCVLCDDTAVGTAADVNVAVYTAGCFNEGALTVKDGYTMTQADKDKLRERGIYLGTVLD